MLTERAFDTGELIINYGEGETDGPPLVLLHGSTLHWQTFDELIPALERKWRVYACDLRGHGVSARAASGYRIADFVPDTVAFVERWLGRPAVLVGFSTGAMVALGVAAQVPGLVRAIVVLDPPLMNRDTPMRELGPYGPLTWVSETLAASRSLEDVVERCREHYPDYNAVEVRRQALRVASIDPASLPYLLEDRFFDGFDLETTLPGVACPTLLVRGNPQLGGLVRDSDVALLQNHLQRLTTYQIDGADHGVIWGEPGKHALEQIMRFLDSL